MTVPQSKIQVDSIESYDPPGPVVILQGAIVPPGQTFSVEGDVNIVGVVTASNFVGDGSGLTGISVATSAKTIAFTYIT